jgi:hypothetical protein
VDSGSVFLYQFAFLPFSLWSWWLCVWYRLVSMTLSVVTFASVSFFLLSLSGYPPFASSLYRSSFLVDCWFSFFRVLPVDADSTLLIHAVGYGPRYAHLRRSEEEERRSIRYRLSLPLQDAVNTGFAILAEVRSASSLCRVLSSFTLATRLFILFSHPHTAVYPLTFLP